MTCPHCQAANELFDDQVARKDLKRYRKKGPDKSTRLLLDAIAPYDVNGQTLLDIGGGIGIVQHELVARGVSRTTDVDASIAYLEAARSEADRRGYAKRAYYLHGDFVEISNRVDDAGLVTLDRVVCCYPDALLLLDRATAHARKRIGLVWPKDAWWTHVFAATMNAWFAVVRNPFRLRVHSDRLIAAAMAKNGFTRRSHARSGFWQVAAYERAA